MLFKTGEVNFLYHEKIVYVGKMSYDIDEHKQVLLSQLLSSATIYLLK